MTDDDVRQHLEGLRQGGYRIGTTGSHVLFVSKEDADKYWQQHDVDLVPIGDGWLAKHHETSPAPMPTRRGDVVIARVHQRFAVWTVTTDDAQEPEDGSARLDLWDRSEAERVAHERAADTDGNVFRRQIDVRWSVIPRQMR